MNKSSKFESSNDNIFRCRLCGSFAIFEELDQHECRGIKAKEIEGKICKVFDGEFWYPLKLDQLRPTSFDREKFRHRLDRTSFLDPLTVRIKCK